MLVLLDMYHLTAWWNYILKMIQTGCLACKEFRVAALRKFVYCCCKESTADCQFCSANNAILLSLLNLLFWQYSDFVIGTGEGQLQI